MLDAYDLLLKATNPPFAKKKRPDADQDAPSDFGAPENSDTAPGEDDEGLDGVGDSEESDFAEGDQDDPELEGDQDAPDDQDDPELEGDQGEAEGVGPEGGDDPQALIQQLADAERDYYAAKGFHGPQHHNAAALLDTYHKLVRKLVRAVQGGASGLEDADAGEAEPNEPDEDGQGDEIDDEQGDEIDDEQEGAEPPQFGGKTPKAKKPPFGKSGDAIDGLGALYSSSSLRKAQSGEVHPSHKYLLRKPDGKGRWKYVYSTEHNPRTVLVPKSETTLAFEKEFGLDTEPEYAEEHGFSGLATLDAIRNASENGRSSKFLMPHEGKVYVAQIKATSDTDPTLEVVGRELRGVSPGEARYEASRSIDSKGGFTQMPLADSSSATRSVPTGDEKQLFTTPANSPKKRAGMTATWNRGWQYSKKAAVKKSEHSEALQQAFNADALRKGLEGFSDDSTKVVIPERYLLPYLVSFVETSYGVVSQESPQAMHDEKAMAEAIMRQLVQSIGASSNLRAATNRYKMTADAIAKILRDRQVITVTESLAARSTLPTDGDSHEALGSGDIEGTVFQLSKRPDWYKADPDKRQGRQLSLVPAPGYRVRYVDDRAVPRFGMRAGAALDYSERDRIAKASIAGDCVIHGYRAVQQTDMLTHAFGACSCPNS